MKWFDLRSWAIGLAVGGLLVSLWGRFEKEPVPHHPSFKLGKYVPVVDGNRTTIRAGLATLIFRADGIVEVESWGNGLPPDHFPRPHAESNDAMMGTGKVVFRQPSRVDYLNTVRDLRPTYAATGKWKLSGGLVSIGELKMDKGSGAEKRLRMAGIIIALSRPPPEETGPITITFPPDHHGDSLDPRHFKMDVMSDDLPHGATQLIEVKSGTKDYLRRDFVRWKWVED